MNFKNLPSKRSETQKVHEFHSYEILQHAKLTNNDRKQISGCLGQAVNSGAD